MGSREQNIALGPASGKYQHKSVPAEDEDIPSFLQDEFLAVGSIVNGILEGGAFPPTAEMPQRWREGMMIFFSQAVLPNISSAGVWLYRSEKWWKIIDDPSVVEGFTFVYALGNDQAPAAPITGPGFPPLPQPLWQVTPPAKNTKADYIWASALVNFDGVDRYWETPVMWSAGVIDGSDGATGAPGIPGHRSITNLTDPVLRNAWDNQAAYDLVVAEVFDRDPIVPINGDTVTQHSAIPTEAGDPPTFIETNSYQVGSGNPGIWEPVEEFIDGNLVVNGTVNGGAIRADSEVRIGGNAGTDLVVISAADPNSRIWIGGNDSSGAVFRVDPTGKMFATEGEFTGDVLGGNISGTTSIKVPASATTTSGFLVDNLGNLYAESGTFRGEIQSEQLQGDVTTVKKYVASNTNVTDESSGVLVSTFPILTPSSKERVLILSQLGLSVIEDSIGDAIASIKAIPDWDGLEYSSTEITANATSSGGTKAETEVSISIPVPLGISGSVSIYHVSVSPESNFVGYIATLYFEGDDLGASTFSLNNGVNEI